MPLYLYITSTMKSIVRTTLLVLWLFAIGAPSLITLCDVDNPIVVTNLNEEEHQETGKKSQAEEKFVNDHDFDYSLIKHSKESEISDFHLLGTFDHILEIVPPPPEQSC